MVKYSVKMKLCQKEVALIDRLRNKYRYGDVEIYMRDGIPQIVKKAYESDELNKTLDKQT